MHTLVRRRAWMDANGRSAIVHGSLFMCRGSFAILLLHLGSFSFFTFSRFRPSIVFHHGSILPRLHV